MHMVKVGARGGNRRSQDRTISALARGIRECTRGEMSSAFSSIDVTPFLRLFVAFFLSGFDVASSGHDH